MGDDIASYAVNDPVERRLLDAIAADPADPQTRSVYADWLESMGGAAHAEFLRAQLALAGVEAAADPVFQAASVRLRELAARLEPGWRARVAMAFVEACPPEVARRTMWAVTVAEGTGDPRRIVLDVPEITIGRAKGNDIVLAAGEVADRHARIVVKDGRFIAVDLRSDLGTYVNGRRMTTPVLLKPTEAIDIAAFRIAVHTVGVDERPTTPRTEASRLAMELVCPQRWDRLSPTADPGVRHCGACKRDVHYCTSVEQAREVAFRGGCVAVDLRTPRMPGDLNPPRPPPMMGAPLPPPRSSPSARQDDFEDEAPTVPAPRP
jgi:uncharacterized protein (TIGR02996 family)